MSNSRLALILFLMLPALLSTAIAEESNFSYIGSYSFSRGTESGHTYVSEFRLWRNGDSIEGVYLYVAGLSGDSVAMAQIITKGSLSANGEIILNTKRYSFSGKKSKKFIRGVLKHFGDVVWGGIEGSDSMTLKRDITIYWVPESNIKTHAELQRWLSSLKNVEK